MKINAEDVMNAITFVEGKDPETVGEAIRMIRLAMCDAFITAATNTQHWSERGATRWETERHKIEQGVIGKQKR